MVRVLLPFLAGGGGCEQPTGRESVQNQNDSADWKSGWR